MGKWRRNKSKAKRWIRNHLINKYGAVCHYCDEPFASMKDITLDHHTPVSKGGTDEIENIRLAHAPCNQSKKDMTPEEFEAFQNAANIGDLVE